jgi:peptidoglycan-associated lipoprotein
MQRTVVLLLAGILVAGVLFGLTGCAKKPPVDEPITDAEAEAEAALSGEDIPLDEPPEDVLYIEAEPDVFENIHFDYDKYDIRPRDEVILQGIAGWLKEHDTKRVLIEGHCDERGTNEYNMALGEQRALAARRFLVGLGIESSRLVTISYGEERPLALGSTEDAWARNRRAHFVVSE